jgi:hypothetical protein
VYLGEDLLTCRAEVFGRGALVPLRCFWVRARVDVLARDLRVPDRELGRRLGSQVRAKAHSWAIRRVATEARRRGLQGIVYRSVRMDGKECLALFLENLTRGQLRRGRWRRLPLGRKQGGPRT